MCPTRLSTPYRQKKLEWKFTNGEGPTLRAASRNAVLLLCLLILSAFARASGDRPAQSVAMDEAHEAPGIVIGFVGGLLHHKVEHYMDVADELRARYGDRIRIEIVYNGRGDRKRALRLVHKWLDSDGDGKLSDAEK